jgi:hypothetical protein
VDLDRVHVLVDHGAAVVDAELGEQVRDLAALGSQDLVLRLELPEPSFERPERLLAGRVHELLVGLARLALIGRVGEAPAFDLAVERLGEGRVLVQRVLEAGRKVDLSRLDRRESMEQLVRQGRRTVLDRASFLPGILMGIRGVGSLPGGLTFGLDRVLGLD